MTCSMNRDYTDDFHRRWKNPLEYMCKGFSVVGASGAAMNIGALIASGSSEGRAIELLSLWATCPIGTSSTRSRLTAAMASAISGGGNVCTPVPRFPVGKGNHRPARAPGALVRSAAATEGGTGTSITATLGTEFAENYSKRFATAVGQEDANLFQIMLPETSVFLPPDEGVVLRMAAMTTSDVIAPIWFWREWEER